MNHCLKTLGAVLVAVLVIAGPIAAAEKVSARTETVTIPTFALAGASPNPAVYEEQETSGAYPRSVMNVSSRSEKPADKEYKMLVLENELLRVEVLPEVGGRVWRIIDKKTGENLLWTNDAVKPINVGRRRGWIAGGIEFPFPVSNHGADTIDPYRSRLVENEDGSATATVSTFDHFYRFWGSYDVTLRPGDARMALTVRLYNPTEVKNRYQIWINGAVKTGKDMQFIFPVDWVAGHGFGGVHPWPMWDDGKFDHSYWANVPDMFGVFGWDADYMGAYYHRKDFGVIRYSSHSFTRGIKLWTWGTESRWVQEYSLNQGPYNEIQGGRWPTQEMYGFLEPHQMDTWTEYWYPVSGLGGVSLASKDAALSVKYFVGRRKSQWLDVRINVLTDVDGKLVVAAGEKTLLSKSIAAKSGEVIKETVDATGLAPADKIAVSLFDKQGFCLIAYEKPLEKVMGSKAEKPAKKASRAAAKAQAAGAKKPAGPEVPQSVVLPGTGPEWQGLAKAISLEINGGDVSGARDAYKALTETKPDFAAAWKSLGIVYYKQFEDESAEQALSKAVELDTADAEARYYLGVVKLELGRPDALDVLRGVDGNVEYAHAAKVAVGRQLIKDGRYPDAVAGLADATRGWSRDAAAWDCLAVAARLANDRATADTALSAALAAEPLDAFAMAERVLAGGSGKPADIQAALGSDDDLYLETALFYADLGLARDALAVAQAGVDRATSGLYYYYLGYLAGKADEKVLAGQYLARAEEMGIGYVFPHRREDIAVLDYASAANGRGGYPKYHEGTLLYWLGRADDALALWEGLLGKYDVPGLYRNVATAYTRGRIFEDYQTAISMYRKALEADPKDIEAYYALDDLYSRQHGRRERRDILEKGREAFPEDDQMALRMASFLATAHDAAPAEAARILETHKFHKAHQAYELRRLGGNAIQQTYGALAARALRNGDKKLALKYLQKVADAEETVSGWFE